MEFLTYTKASHPKRLFNVTLVPLDKAQNEGQEQLNSGIQTLTNREREILALVARGLQSNGIAAILHISKHTVDTHRRHIIKKLDIRCIMDWIHAARLLQVAFVILAPPPGIPPFPLCL